MMDIVYGMMAGSCLGAAIWASGMIYILPLKRRDNFAIRILLIFIASCIMGVFLVYLYKLGVSSGWVEYILAYLLLIFLVWTCAKVRVNTVFYYGICSFITLKLIFEAVTIFNQVTGAEGYGRWLNALWILVTVDIVIAFTIARWMPEDGTFEAGPRQLTSAVFLLLIFEMLSEVLYRNHTLGFVEGNWAIIVLTQIYCVTIIYLQAILFKKSAMRQKMMTMDFLWHQQKDQYNLAKENIDLINRKCHDLKHQMSAMRMMMRNEEGEKYLSEIEKSIRIYNSIVKSGNEVLDTILTEKSLYCEANQINISCVADGSTLSFIEPVDLYTIFGNAIDNAIESVQNFTDEGKRIVDVLVYAKQQFLVINISNPLEKKLTFKDNLPVSTKAKTGYHGFGLKSIKHTVQKYNGLVQVEVEDDCFYLKIVIPL